MRKIALLIGVSEYQSGLNPLLGAVKDVEAMQRVLQHPEMGGFAEADMVVLKNPQRGKMETAIEQLFSARQKEDLLLFYFSGHGILDDRGKLYLTNNETRKNDGNLVKTSATAASLIHEMMENSRSQRQVIILDSCFSGAFAQGMKAKDDHTIDINKQLGGKGRAVLTSSSATQYSFEQEGEELSVYTRYLVEGIETGAAATDNDSMISINELHEYARKKVQEAAPAMSPKIYTVEEGFKIKLAKAPSCSRKLEYRKKIEELLKDGEISPIGRRILKLRQQELGLSDDEIKQIEYEVFEPLRKHQANLKEYEEALQEILQHETTLSERTQAELKLLQGMLKLRDEDIEPIHKNLISSSKLVSIPDDIPQPNKIINIGDDELRSEKDIDYTRLRDLLKAGNWEEADAETYRVMIQVVGRKDGDYIRDKEMLNFPCADLLTIDRLWVKYSNGRFGFSVQKKIYLSVGGKFDGSYNQEAWEKFGNAVGWRVNNKWINNTDKPIIFDTLAPKGHLPALVFLWIYGSEFGVVVSSLASRLVNCNI